MSAADLRNYMTEMQMAKASKSVDGMDRAEKARQDLVKRLAEPIDLTPERLKEILQSLKAKLRAAAERGQTELMVMRFPNALCTDKGRAINNADPDLARDPHRPAAPGLRALARPAQGRRLQAQRDDHRVARRTAGRRRLLPQMGRHQAVTLTFRASSMGRVMRRIESKTDAARTVRQARSDRARARADEDRRGLSGALHRRRCSAYVDAVKAASERLDRTSRPRSASPLDLWRDASSYWLDFAQRSILFWDTLRQRGNNWIEHEKAGKPPLLRLRMGDGRGRPHVSSGP